MKFPTLYGKDSKGGLKVWEVSTEVGTIFVTHGKLGGKMQTKRTVAESKNIGKANETTPEEQADIEAEAKWVKQKKSGYFETETEALAFEEFSPMKAHNYKDYAKKVVFPVHQSVKLDGLRLMVDADGNAWSKAGEVYTLPPHIQAEVDRLRSLDPDFQGLDGEIFAGAGVLSLQQISSAFRKPNENTPLLKLYVYDIPVKNVPFGLRMKEFEHIVGYENIIIAPWAIVFDQEHSDRLYHEAIKAYEGVVYRSLDGLYEFGKRSYGMIKRKPRADVEARVISVREDKNGQGVLTTELETGVTVDALMLKEADGKINYRLYENALTLIGKYITIEFEDYSDDGVPLKPVGAKLRDVSIAEDGTWIVKE